jgi:hypothetical protein
VEKWKPSYARLCFALRDINVVMFTLTGHDLASTPASEEWVGTGEKKSKVVLEADTVHGYSTVH